MSNARYTKLVPALAGVVLAIALAVPAHADTIAEQNYIVALHQQGIGGASDAAFIQAGHSICADFHNGSTNSQEAQKIMDTFQLPYVSAAFLVGAAALDFCPS